MTCRGSRFADGATRNPDGKVFMKNRETDEWLKQNEKSTKNFIRKWGHFVMHDSLMKPIIPPKYKIGIVVKNCTNQILETLEPWCTKLYVDIDYKDYIDREKNNTKFDLNKRIFSIHSKVEDEIEVRIDGSRFSNRDYEIIRNLSQILNDSGEIGSFEIENLEIGVNSLESFELELITINRRN